MRQSGKKWVSRFIIRAKKRPNIICQFSDFLDIIKRGERESRRLVVKNKFNMQKKKAKENWGERKRVFFLWFLSFSVSSSDHMGVCCGTS